jgi:uncharacterized membrane protein (DUF2068 family)
MVSTPPERVRRPLPVSLVALYQFSKAGFLLLVAALLSFDPYAVRDSHLDISGFTAFIAADGSTMVALAADQLYGRNPLGLSVRVLAASFVFLGCWLVYIGWGLWRLKAWARKTRIGVSAIQALFALRLLLVYLPLKVNEHSPRPTSEQWRDFGVLLLLNLLIIFYLVRDADVLHAFARQE